MVEDGIEGTVLMVGGAAKFNAGRPFRTDPLFELLHEPGLANASLPTEQHDLAFALFRLLPAPLQVRLSSSSDPPTELSPFAWPPQSGCAPSLSLTTRYSVSGVATPLRVGCPRVLTRKQAFDQAIGRRTDHHLVRLACPWTRAAMFGVSPKASRSVCSPAPISPTTTGPV